MQDPIKITNYNLVISSVGDYVNPGTIQGGFYAHDIIWNVEVPGGVT